MKFLLVSKVWAEGWYHEVHEVEVDQSDSERAVFGDDLLEVLEAFKEIGLSEFEVKNGRIYKVAEEWEGKELWVKAKGEYGQPGFRGG